MQQVLDYWQVSSPNLCTCNSTQYVLATALNPIAALRCLAALLLARHDTVVPGKSAKTNETVQPPSLHNEGVLGTSACRHTRKPTWNHDLIQENRSLTPHIPSATGLVAQNLLAAKNAQMQEHGSGAQTGDLQSSLR